MSQSDKEKVMSYHTMRQWIGIMGMALPWACWVANALVNGLNLLNNPKFALLDPISKYEPDGLLKSSISHFYYTASGPLFIGIIVTVAIFLFCYKGHEEKPKDKFGWVTDDLVTTWAAIFALGIVIFPTGSDKPISDNLFVFTASALVGWAHYISAALFFIMMAVLCFINFRRRGDKGPFGSGENDLLFRSCGWIILGSIAIVFIYGFFLKEHLKLNWPVTFIFEAVALAAFGIAWLVKGKFDLTLNLSFKKSK